VLDETLAELGVPDGAAFTATAPGRPPAHLLLPPTAPRPRQITTTSSDAPAHYVR
jgi:hypothetical protein